MSPQSTYTSEQNKKPWYVYVLLCSDKSLYTGYTDNVQARFATHQLGKGSKYTRSHKPLKVLYTEQLPTKSDALKREAEIKRWTRVQKIARLNLEVYITIRKNFKT